MNFSEFENVIGELLDEGDISEPIYNFIIESATKLAMEYESYINYLENKDK